MRLALLSNVTVDLLAEMLGKKHEVYLSAGFNAWEQEILNVSSPLYDFKAEALVLLLHAGAAEWTDENDACNAIDEWVRVVEIFAEKCSNTPVFVSSLDAHIDFCDSKKHIDGIIESYFIQCLEELHDNGYKVYSLPVKTLITDIGRGVFYSKKMWYVGSMPYSIKGIDALNSLIDTYVSAIKGRKKKCLALDLDNTLWGGVIAEDGTDGILLSNHKEGARYYDAQKLLKKMKDQGVMLSIISKNNLFDVEPVFNHPFMVLKKSDFVDAAINWDSKAENIRKMAERLNIGLDSFVFLDDNAAEREEMKARRPEVATVDFPKDTSLLPDTIRKIYNDYFLSLETTAEDAKKTEMYRAEAERKEIRASATTVEDYLKKLEMTLSVHKMRAEEENRVVQLINKTNQFNVTTKRYGAEDLHELLKEADIFTARVSDRYGDEGLVVVLIVKYSGDTAMIDSFLMSCRVMGRKVEDEVLAILKDYLNSKSVKKICAEYVKTAKNAPVENLFDRLGFSCLSSGADKKEYAADVEALSGHTDVFKEVIFE